MNENMEGIIITDNMQYLGFLSAQSLLKVLNDQNLAIARDLNPQSLKPGNCQILSAQAEGGRAGANAAYRPLPAASPIPFSPVC